MMMTVEVVKKIEQIIERKLSSEEVYAVTHINDEGWKEISPVMRAVMTIIESAKEVTNE